MCARSWAPAPNHMRTLMVSNQNGLTKRGLTPRRLAQHGLEERETPEASGEGMVAFVGGGHERQLVILGRAPLLVSCFQRGRERQPALAAMQRQGEHGPRLAARLDPREQLRLRHLAPREVEVRERRRLVQEGAEALARVSRAHEVQPTQQRAAPRQREQRRGRQG
eukprot:5620617-Prymnesium_polylepis.3